jgi:hypothetical protein
VKRRTASPEPASGRLKSITRQWLDIPCSGTYGAAVFGSEAANKSYHQQIFVELSS